MKETLRVAVCQLTCHPAIYTGQQMWLEEPFIPENRTHTLSYLSVQGFKVDHLLEKCKEAYIAWHADRLSGVLEFLKTLHPIPSLVIFPEGSIPYQCLTLIHAFCSETKATVFAGTHSFQRLKELRQIYNVIGVKERTIEKLHKKAAEVNGIAPIFVHDKVFMVPKKIFSPFESTDISPSEIASERFVPFNIPLGDRKTTVLPLICAEALNFTKLKIRGDYAICVILSYDKTPAHFRALVDMLVANKKTVVYCNDGRFGGSGLLIPIDQRRAMWWYDSGFKGQLPTGDAILIADIDLRNIAVEIGVTSPSINFNLVKLCSITYGKDPACSLVSEEMERIKRIEEPFTKTKAIKELLQTNCANEVQEERLRFLQQLALAGKDTEDWWIAIGCDCVLNLPSLEQLESELAGYCYDQLLKEILEHGKGTPGVEELREFLRQAKLLAESRKESLVTVSVGREEIKSIINREEDVKETLSFLDNQRQKIAQISGLQEIGKSSVVEKALAQCQSPRVIEIEVNESSSAEYLVYKILPNIFQNKEKNIEASTETMAKLNETDFLAAFNRTDIVWIYKAENLLQLQNWKNEDIAAVIKMIIMAAKKSDIKIIFETRRELPLEIEDSTIYFRKRIMGLERTLKPHGVSYLDYQLRRVGISPSDIDSLTKEKIVEKMGGHPVALALCADAIYDEGIGGVMEALRGKKGFYVTFVGTLLRNINLNPA